MSAFNIIVSICVFVFVALLIIYIAFPNETTRRRRRKEKPSEDPGKDWETVSLKLEKHILTLRAEIEKLQAEQRRSQRELVGEKEKNARLLEKLSQEKEWLLKEQQSMDKKDHEMRTLKQNQLKIEADLENDHSQKLRLESQARETKQELDNLTKEKREMSLKIMRLESELENYKQELLKQNKINMALKKEDAEANWVAKTEYERLEKLLKEKEVEVTKLRRSGYSSS